MKINIRADSVVIEGYVNAVERASKPLFSRFGEFIEKICAGAFGRALKRNDDVRILLNHDASRDLGGTGSGELELEEDNIGLRVRATITDPEVIEKARAGKLRGWSFGFEDREVENGLQGGMLLRLVKDLFLHEVSVLDDRKTPAYAGTQVYARSVDGEDRIIYRGEDNNEDVEVVEVKKEEPQERDDEKTTENEPDVQKPVENSEPQDKEVVDNNVDNHEQNIENLDKIDYSRYEQMIKSMKEDASC